MQPDIAATEFRFAFHSGNRPGRELPAWASPAEQEQPDTAQSACSQRYALLKEHLDEPIAEPARQSQSRALCPVGEPTLVPGQADLLERTVQQLVQKLEQSPVPVQQVLRT